MALKPNEHNRLTEDEMTFQFLHILQEATHQLLPPPVGILTTERRDTWAVVREKLREGEMILISIHLHTATGTSTLGKPTATDSLTTVKIIGNQILTSFSDNENVYHTSIFFLLSWFRFRNYQKHLTIYNI
jgi:hypothetical protein